MADPVTQSPEETSASPIATQDSSSDGTVQEGRYGANNRDLPEHLQEALKKLDEELATPSQILRWEEIFLTQFGHNYFAGKQYVTDNYSGAADYANSAYGNSPQGPFLGVGGDDSNSDLPPQYTINTYQKFCKAYMSTFSQVVPGLAFEPVSTQNETDVQTSRHAKAVSDLVDRFNDPTQLFSDSAYYSWVGAKVLAYTRYVSDPNRFGERTLEVDDGDEEVELEPAAVACVNCGAETPAPDDQPIPAECPQCAAPMDENNYRPAQTGMKQKTKQQTFANGMSVTTILDAMNVATPIGMDNLYGMPYLRYDMEVYREKLQAAYPWMRDKFTSDTGGTSAESQTERLARESVISKNQLGLNAEDQGRKLTWSRRWYQKEAFECITEEATRKELAELFPHGCHVIFSGGHYCESRDENMLDHWDLVNMMPGKGQFRASVGDCVFDSQDLLNDFGNIAADTIAHGVPTPIIDSSLMDPNYYRKQVALAGNAVFTKIQLTPGDTMAQHVMMMEGAKLPEGLVDLIKWLQSELPSDLTGLYPSVLGAQAPGQKTAKGQEIERDQSLGNIALFWRKMLPFYSSIKEKQIRCMANNYPADIEIPEPDGAGDFTAKNIPIDELQGRVRVSPEVDAAIPTSWSQTRQDILTVATSPFAQSPVGQESLQMPENLAWMFKYMGMNGFKISTLDAWKQQKWEIEQILAGNEDIAVDPLLDNHQIHLQTIQHFACSPKGMSERRANPAAWAKLEQHAQQHSSVMAEQAQAAQPKNKPLSESLTAKFTDLPPEAQIDILEQQFGIQLSPATKAVMMQPPTPALAPPTGTIQ